MNPDLPAGRSRKMDSFQAGKEYLKNRERGEEKHLEYKKTLFQSGLLEKIEKKRLEFVKDNAYKFDLYPRPTYRSLNSDHFLKELSLVHTQFSVDHSGHYVSFCIEVKPGGIYLVPSGKNPKKIDPQKITDREIHNWFDLLVRH
jgi:hypothetical protein